MTETLMHVLNCGLSILLYALYQHKGETVNCFKTNRVKTEVNSRENNSE